MRHKLFHIYKLFDPAEYFMCTNGYWDPDDPRFDSPIFIDKDSRYSLYPSSEAVLVRRATKSDLLFYAAKCRNEEVRKKIKNKLKFLL